MKIKFLKFFTFGFFFLLLSAFFASSATAEEVIRNFDVKIVATQNGQMHVTETIRYDFGDSDRHGIFRNINRVSRLGNLYRQINVAFQRVLKNANPEPYEVNTDSGTASVKIGDPNKTISGIHTYQIIYLVKNGIGSNYEDHDEIYWSVTGNEWTVPIENASVLVETDFGVLANRAACFTGVAGETTTDCAVPSSAPFNPIRTVNSLGAGEGLTVVYGFSVNTFPKSQLLTEDPSSDVVEFKNFLKVYAVFWLGLNFILAPALLIWYFKNKRKERFGKPAVNFDFPQDQFKKRIGPAEAGIMDTAKLDREDVVATIFDLAIRKYIKLEEVREEKKMLGLIPNSKEELVIKKLKDYSDPQVSSFEKELLDRLFEKGDSVKVNDLKTDFYKAFEQLDKKAFSALVERGFYKKNPKAEMSALLVFGIVALATANVILGPVLILLSKKMTGRTARGDQADWQIDGLKIFLKNMSRNYKWQAENFYTVEKMIPYAMALGYIDDYMKQLQIIKPDYSPTWYSGYHGSFYDSSPSMLSSFSSNVITSAPGSSSGFSGGSSGGGGGGGGGGSW